MIAKEFVELLIAETDESWGRRVRDKLPWHISGAGWSGTPIKLLGLEGACTVGKRSEAPTGLATAVGCKGVSHSDINLGGGRTGPKKGIQEVGNGARWRRLARQQAIFRVVDLQRKCGIDKQTLLMSGEKASIWVQPMMEAD